MATEPWKDFVVSYGYRASLYELAAVVGQPVAVIGRLRSTGVCDKRAKPLGFEELFALWNGRSPTDGDWPPPRKLGAQRSYEWQVREIAFLASLVGRMDIAQIVVAVNNRLRAVTGDPEASRSSSAVQIRVNRIGLQATDIVGGITAADAAREINSTATVYAAIAKRELRAFRQGRLWVIPHAAWRVWKSGRTVPPEGYVQLSTLRERLGIRSDKLSEYARMGLIQSAIFCNTYETETSPSRYGTWWVAPDIAQKILSDRQAGRPMPWSGRYAGNLRKTFQTWQERRHPEECAACKEIWAGRPPRDYDEFVERYPALAHGAKRHLTRPWAPGLTVSEIAADSGRTAAHVRLAVRNGVLEMSEFQGRAYATRTEVTLWKARKCPTGENQKSWITLETAAKYYLFTKAELKNLVENGTLQSKVGTDGAARGVTYILKRQCRQLRNKIGFSEEEAARRVGVTVEKFRHLLAGVDWRKADGIPLETVQAVIKRAKSKCGFTLEEAAAELGVPTQWIKDHKHLIRVSRAKWDMRRTYISAPMLERLRAVKEKPPAEKTLGPDWLRLSAAAKEAGVTTGTLTKWIQAGELETKPTPHGKCMHREAVRARARRYWENPRLTRAVPPAWLSENSVW